MNKRALGIFLIAVIGAVAVSACTRIPGQIELANTARPQQGPEEASQAPHRPNETERPYVPLTTPDYGSHADVEPSASVNTEEPAAEQSEMPRATSMPAEPTLAPHTEERVNKLESFSFADNDIVPVDLDYDGISETVSIVQDADSGAMKLVIDAADKYEISIDMDVSSLVCAYVTDFCFGDGSAELIVSYLKPDGSYATSVVGSFSSDTPVSCAVIDGWVESLTEEGIRLCRTADVLGMRGISMLHTYNSENGSFVPLDKEWAVYSYGQYACLASELFAEVFADGVEQELLLEAGTLILPTATDFYSYIDFETDGGLKGRLSVSYENGESFMYDGVELNSLLEELPML